MLKPWKMSGAAAVLTMVLSACSTTPLPAPTTSDRSAAPDSAVFITQFTNSPATPIPVSIGTNVSAVPAQWVAKPAATPPPALPPSIPPVVPPVRPPETNRLHAVKTNTAPAVASPAQPAPARLPVSRRVRRATWVPWSEWAEENGWSKPERLRNLPTWTYQIRGSRGVLEATAGKQTALWNGLNLELGFAPRRSGDDLLIHALDLEKTFEPLTVEPALLHQPSRIIVIDPGHGGFNYGAKSALGSRYEKEFALDWAVRLGRLLESRGWTVHLTRTNDVDLSLLERIAIADRLRADLFLSLHFNSSEDSQAKSEHGGIETYCLTPVGMPSSLTRHYDDGHKQSFPNNAFDAENYHFAVRLHRALVQATDRKDRGVRRARFMGVLKGHTRPAVLLEAGYLTSLSEARLISTPAYRQKLAEAVARALSP